MFEHGEDMVAQSLGIGKLLQVKSVPGKVTVAKVVGDAPGADNKLVVWQFTTAGRDRLVVQINCSDFGKDKASSWQAANQSPYRVGYGLLFEPCSCHLVKQWLEQMIVVPINQDDFHPLAGKLPCCPDPSKPHADDYCALHDIPSSIQDIWFKPWRNLF